jgi:hypothetical protein
MSDRQPGGHDARNQPKVQRFYENAGNACAYWACQSHWLSATAQQMLLLRLKCRRGTTHAASAPYMPSAGVQA